MNIKKKKSSWKTTKRDFTVSVIINKHINQVEKASGSYSYSNIPIDNFIIKFRTKKRAMKLFNFLCRFQSQKGKDKK